MQSLFSVTNNVSLVSITVTPGTFLAVVALLLCFLTLYIPVVPHIRLPRVSLPRNLWQPPSPSPPQRHASHGSESPTSALVHRRATSASSSSFGAAVAATTATASGRRHNRLQKVLPALPPPPRSRGALPAPPSLVGKLAPTRQLALPEFISSYWSGRGRETTPPPPAPPPKHGAHTFTPANNAATCSITNNKKVYPARDYNDSCGNNHSSSSSSSSSRRSRLSSGRFSARLRTSSQPHDDGHLALVDQTLLGAAQQRARGGRGRPDGAGAGGGVEPRRGLGRGLRRWWLLTTGVAEARQRRPQQRLLEDPPAGG